MGESASLRAELAELRIRRLRKKPLNLCLKFMKFWSDQSSVPFLGLAGTRNWHSATEIWKGAPGL